ncbi:hypothetical protein J6590_031320 [Homalodisca vitripennis]|nr:hypothetical protein J6590_031320 [Homalodisca vitripennis]
MVVSNCFELRMCPRKFHHYAPQPVKGCLSDRTSSTLQSRVSTERAATSLPQLLSLKSITSSARLAVYLRKVFLTIENQKNPLGILLHTTIGVMSVELMSCACAAENVHPLDVVNASILTEYPANPSSGWMDVRCEVALITWMRTETSWKPWPSPRT